MTASDIDLPTDRHGRAELLPARQTRPPLETDHRAAWTVIGAGLTGLACARRLAALCPDGEILLLDAREVGQGASGRNSGFAVAVSHFPGGYSAKERHNYARVNRINKAGSWRARPTFSWAICHWDNSAGMAQPFSTVRRSTSNRCSKPIVSWISSCSLPQSAAGREVRVKPSAISV